MNHLVTLTTRLLPPNDEKENSLQDIALCFASFARISTMSPVKALTIFPVLLYHESYNCVVSIWQTPL
jgi:hypothetical protein